MGGPSYPAPVEKPKEVDPDEKKIVEGSPAPAEGSETTT